MSKKVLIISSSLRNRSNSELLSMSFAGGFTDAVSIQGSDMLKKAFAMGSAIQ